MPNHQMIDGQGELEERKKKRDQRVKFLVRISHERS